MSLSETIAHAHVHVEARHNWLTCKQQLASDGQLFSKNKIILSNQRIHDIVHVHVYCNIQQN